MSIFQLKKPTWERWLFFKNNFYLTPFGSNPYYPPWWVKRRKDGVFFKHQQFLGIGIKKRFGICWRLNFYPPIDLRYRKQYHKNKKHFFHFCRFKIKKLLNYLFSVDSYQNIRFFCNIPSQKNTLKGVRYKIAFKIGFVKQWFVYLPSSRLVRVLKHRLYVHL